MDVVINRWQLLSGKDAVLDGDGRTFAEVAKERNGAEREWRVAAARSRISKTRYGPGIGTSRACASGRFLGAGRVPSKLWRLSSAVVERPQRGPPVAHGWRLYRTRAKSKRRKAAEAEPRRRN